MPMGGIGGNRATAIKPHHYRHSHAKTRRLGYRNPLIFITSITEGKKFRNFCPYPRHWDPETD
jgi:hypothetical protein